MIGYVDAPRVWPLAAAMARAAGVDLPRAVFDGWLRRDELEVIVDRCTDCGVTHACADWLSQGATPDLPGFCANKPGIEALG